jgi:hypothetical protein
MSEPEVDVWEWMRREIPSEPKEMDQKPIVKYACCVTKNAVQASSISRI